MNSIPEDKILEILKAGVGRTRDFLAQMTEYHPGQVKTEYMLTVDIAREFIGQGFDVSVECLNRSLIDGWTAVDIGSVRSILKAKRADVVAHLLNSMPAIVEVKISHNTLGKIKKDLDKIIATIRCLKPQFAANLVGASVFEVHVKNPKHFTKSELLKRVHSIEVRMQKQLHEYAATKAGYSFAWHPLQEATDGVTEVEIFEDPDHGAELGRDGNATRYHAIIVRSLG